MIITFVPPSLMTTSVDVFWLIRFRPKKMSIQKEFEIQNKNFFLSKKKLLEPKRRREKRGEKWKSWKSLFVCQSTKTTFRKLILMCLHSKQVWGFGGKVTPKFGPLGSGVRLFLGGPNRIFLFRKFWIWENEPVWSGEVRRAA